MKAKGAAAVLAIPGALLLLAGPGLAQVPVYSETFDNGTNAGGWSFGAPVEGIQPTGGAPGPYLRGSELDTTIPFLATAPGVASPFTGNYRTRQITIVDAGLNVFHTDFNIGARPPAVILYSENGTPGDTSDDWGAYALAADPLGPAGVWFGFRWPIASQQSALPAGWSYIDFGPNVPPGRNWDTLVQHVDRLMFSFGDPSLFYIFQMWDVGADSIVIEQSGDPACYANCDRSTTPPALNVLDFGCFLNRFAAGDTYANCDQSTTQPVLNVLDFACFLNKFAAGCSAP